MFICTHCPGGHCEDIEFTDAPGFCPSIGISAEEELARYNEEDKSAAHAAAIVEGRYSPKFGNATDNTSKLKFFFSTKPPFS